MFSRRDFLKFISAGMMAASLGACEVPKGLDLSRHLIFKERIKSGDLKRYFKNNHKISKEEWNSIISQIPEEISYEIPLNNIPIKTKYPIFVDISIIERNKRSYYIRPINLKDSNINNIKAFGLENFETRKAEFGNSFLIIKDKSEFLISNYHVVENFCDAYSKTKDISIESHPLIFNREKKVDYFELADENIPLDFFNGNIVQQISYDENKEGNLILRVSIKNLIFIPENSQDNFTNLLRLKKSSLGKSFFTSDMKNSHHRLSLGESGSPTIDLETGKVISTFSTTTEYSYKNFNPAIYINNYKTIHKLISDFNNSFKIPINFSKGSKGKEVILIQTYLSILNNGEVIFYPSKIDGDFGPKTQISLKEFQTFHKLKITGVCDIETYKLLKVEYWKINPGLNLINELFNFNF